MSVIIYNVHTTIIVEWIQAGDPGNENHDLSALKESMNKSVENNISSEVLCSFLVFLIPISRQGRPYSSHVCQLLAISWTHLSIDSLSAVLLFLT